MGDQGAEIRSPVVVTFLDEYNGFSFWWQPMLLKADLQAHSEVTRTATLGPF